MGATIIRQGGSIYLAVRRTGRKRKLTRIGPDDEATREAARALVKQANLELAAERAERSGILAPTLARMANRYLREDTAHLAATTRGDRSSYLADEGPLLGPLGELRLHQITVPVLREWWGEHIEGKGRSLSTGRNYLNVLASIFHYAMDLGIVESSPVTDFRSVLRRRLRTSSGRAAADPGKNVRPIEAEYLPRIVAEARAEGPESEILVLLCLDAGLRLGEALGLTWGRISEKALRIAETRPRGGPKADHPKSGRERDVDLSARLRAALDAYRLRRMRPGPEALVLDLNPANWRKREWRRICERAGCGHRRIKDLRSSYASHLVSAAVPIAYVSAQLGHADIGITARRYARWCRPGYVDPPRLGPDEVPADLLARVGDGARHLCVTDHPVGNSPDLATR